MRRRIPPKICVPVKVSTYEILKPLGRGSMGQVYLAQNSQTGRKVALKLMAALELDPQPESRLAHLRSLFSQEGTMSARFEHPHLINVLECGEHEGLPFIVMEYFESDPLESWINALQQNPRLLSEIKRLRIALQICEGVGYLHAIGILHKDIKPANVLVSGNLKAKV